MITIGIRATPKKIFYSIVDGNDIDDFNIISNDALVVPVALDVPRSLAYIRTNFLSILNEYNVEFAGIRVLEGNSPTKDMFRINLEGVLQEMLAYSGVKRYYLGRLATFGMHLGHNSTLIKEFIDKKNEIIDIPSWNAIKDKEQRESLITAIAALAVGKDA